MPGPARLHCLGGFVTAMQYGLSRRTNDLDYVEVVPRERLSTLEEVAGRGSELAKRYGLHFQHVTVASLPASYDERLAELFPNQFQNLRLFALEPHDLALSKLARNNTVDREDVRRLAKIVPLDPKLLQKRYREELRPYLIGDLQAHDLTLQIWLESYFSA